MSSAQGQFPRDLHGTATRPPSSSTPSGDPGDLVRRDLRVIHFAHVRPDVLSRHVLRIQGDDPHVEPGHVTYTGGRTRPRATRPIEPCRS